MNELTRAEAGALADVRPARRRWRVPLMLAVPLMLLLAGGWLWWTGGRTVSTDNAQVGAHVISIAPEVTGLIVEVAVTENQRVRAGDLLYRIDPAPYRIALLQADAAVGNARLQVARLASEYRSREADIGSTASDVELATENFRRQKDLFDRGFATKAALDAAHAALASAQAKRAVASADAASAQAVVGAGGGARNPQILAALASRAKAELDLKRTEIRAPIAGIVAQTDRLNPGALATAMLPNVSLVGDGDYWVEANFKETQLAKVRIGQPAEVEIDAIPGRTFPAHVSGIGAGTGAEFSLLPAQNATGNWVKVTQRIPVRLRLDAKPDRPLVSGSSAQVTIDVRGNRNR